jgi:hypothetical protein
MFVGQHKMTASSLIKCECGATPRNLVVLVYLIQDTAVIVHRALRSEFDARQQTGERISGKRTMPCRSRLSTSDWQ